MTASASPDAAKVLAASGSSNAPGTHTSVTSAPSTLHSANPRRTPSSRRWVTWSLNRAHTMAMRRPRPSRSGASRVEAATSRDIVFVFVGLLLLVTERVEQMPHPLALGAQVVLVVRVGCDLEGHPLDDLESEPFEATELGRVVRHQPHRRDPEVGEYLRADAVLTAVGRQAELQVGVHGVVALVLEPVGPDLVTDADTTAFV